MGMADVRSNYREFEEYEIEDIKAGEYGNLKGSVLLSDDVYKRINDIESDVQDIIETIKSYDLYSAIDDLEILVKKLY